jgi:hypothetical protein
MLTLNRDAADAAGQRGGTIPVLDLNCHHLTHQIAGRRAGGFHAPELNDFRLAARLTPASRGIDERSRCRWMRSTIPPAARIGTRDFSLESFSYANLPVEFTHKSRFTTKAAETSRLRIYTLGATFDRPLIF